MYSGRWRAKLEREICRPVEGDQRIERLAERLGRDFLGRDARHPHDLAGNDVPQKSVPATRGGPARPEIGQHRLRPAQRLLVRGGDIVVPPNHVEEGDVHQSGAEGARTLNLRIANATLSQLSYRPGQWSPG